MAGWSLDTGGGGGGKGRPTIEVEAGWAGPTFAVDTFLESVLVLLALFE